MFCRTFQKTDAMSEDVDILQWLTTMLLISTGKLQSNLFDLFAIHFVW